jgi:trk system potassium uptake protein TrkA
MHTQYIVIVGCGRLGSNLANHLSVKGHSVVVVDQHKVSFDKLAPDFSGFKVVGDASELQVLKDVELHKADALFAVTTRDSTNLMVAQVAQTVFNVPHVVARVFDPVREEIYREFGVATVNPTMLSIHSFLDMLT